MNQPSKVEQSAAEVEEARERAKILRLVYWEGMWVLISGVMLGLIGALAVTHVLRMVLVGVSPSDPVTLLAAVLVLLLAGIAGCVIPARRAMRVDPIVALRYE
jgi:putative ABC transport system permease protein